MDISDWFTDYRGQFSLGKTFGVIGVILAVLVLVIGGCSLVAGRTYSEGERAGVVTKISRKGLIWKTWEGEMNVGGMHTGRDGSPFPAVWEFTVSSALRDTVDAAAKSGNRTLIRYRQVCIQWPWNGDTDYNVVSVEPATPEKP